MTEEKLDKGRELLANIHWLKKDLDNIGSAKSIEFVCVDENGRDSCRGYMSTEGSEKLKKYLIEMYDKKLTQLEKEFEEL